MSRPLNSISQYISPVPYAILAVFTDEAGSVFGVSTYHAF
jgi:hypothetical protein